MKRTESKTFHEIPAQNVDLFAVNADVESLYALSTAGALEACVRSLLRRSAENGMDGDDAWLCVFAMEAAEALRAAAGATV